MAAETGEHYVTPKLLAFQGPATKALANLSLAQTTTQLLTTAHILYCGTACPRDINCPYLHYHRHTPPAAPPTTARARYNKDTAHLFSPLGPYAAHTPQTPRVNTWPLLNAALARIDAMEGGLAADYTDWTKKGDASVETAVRCVARDVLQWMGLWCGSEYVGEVEGMRFLVFMALADDVCVPPLDLVRGRVRVFGRCLSDVVRGMEEKGWGRDATYVLLGLVRQYVVQYVEKAEFVGVSSDDSWTRESLDKISGKEKDEEKGDQDEKEKRHPLLHQALRQSPSVWDTIVHRTWTSNADSAAIVVARATHSRALPLETLLDCAICNCISMDLAKSALRVYAHDNHPPTAGHSPRAYHSVYLDLADDLVRAGCPEPLVHFATSGLLFVPFNHRYLERRVRGRFDISEAMGREMERVFGERGTDAWLDGRFHLRWLAKMAASRGGGEKRRCEERSGGERRGGERRGEEKSGEERRCEEKSGEERRGEEKCGEEKCGEERSGTEESTDDVDLPKGRHGGVDVSLCRQLLRAVVARQQLRREAWRVHPPAPARTSPPNPPTLRHDDAFAASIHSLAHCAASPSELHVLLAAASLPLSHTGSIAGVASLRDLWALCVGCQVSCGEGCEWLAFARLAASRFALPGQECFARAERTCTHLAEHASSSDAVSV